MEENNVKNRKKAKIIVAVLSVFLLILLVVIGVDVTRKLVEDEVANVPEEEIEVLDKEQVASDEETLRTLLVNEAELVIEVTEDIMIDNSISIKGTKTLTGSGKITMEPYVTPYQYMFVAEKGANLILDGVTIDGNGSANCFKVEKTAQLTLKSGELSWGCPTVIETFGDVHMEGGSIVDAFGTGIYVHSGANLYMTAGTIRDCVDAGIETAVDSYTSISGEAMLQDNMEYFIYNSGTCDITGGTLRYAKSDMVYTKGVMNVKYQGEAGGRLEWYDIKGCAFIVGNGGELNVDNMYIHDVENRIVSTAVGQSVTNISNCLFENIGGAAVYARTEANLKNVEIKNAGYGTKSAGISGHSGIMVIETGKVTIDNVTITGTVKDGIQNAGGIVTGKKLVVNSAGRIGVNSYKANDVEGSVTLDNVTINGTEKSNGLHVETSTLTVKNAKIYNTGDEGARAQKGGSLNLTNAEIHNAKGRSITADGEGSKITLKNVKAFGGKRGIAAFGGNVKATNVSIDSPTEYGITASRKGTVEITDLTIKNSGGTGVNANDAKITITNATIEDTKKTAAVNADYSGTITLKNAEIKFAEGITEKINGVVAAGSATITMKKVNMVNVPERNIYATGAKAKITATDVTTTGGKRSIQVLKGGKVKGENISITSPTEYGVACGDEGSSFDITGLTISRKGDSGVSSGKHAINVYDGAIATVTTGTIAYPGGHGVNVDGDAELTLDDVKIENAGTHGAYIKQAKLILKGTIDIKTPSYRGIMNVGAIVDAKDAIVNVDNPQSFGVSTNVKSETVETGEGKETIVTPGTTTIGELNISGAGDEKEEYSSMTVNGVGTVVTVYKGKITDSWKHGINVEKGTLNLSNFTIENFGQQKADDEEYDGVQAQAGSTVNLCKVKVTGGSHGINILSGGNVTGSDKVTITSPAKYGVRCNGGSFTLADLNVTGSGKQAVNIYNNSTAKVTGKLTITDAGSNGIECSGSDSSQNLKTTFEIEELLVNHSEDKQYSTEGNAVKVYNGAELTVNGGTITNPQYNGASVDTGATLTLKDVDITFDEERTGNLYGVYVSGLGTISLEDVDIANAPRYGIYVWENNDSADIDGADIKATLKNVKTTGGKRGIQIYNSAYVSGENVTITSPSEYGIAAGYTGPDGVAAEFNIKNLTIQSATENGYSSGNDAIYLEADAVGTVNGGIITNPKGDGAEIKSATLTLEKVNINFAPERTEDIKGVRAHTSAKVTLKEVAISNAPKDGIVVWSSSQLLEGSKNITITEPNQYGIWCADANTKFNIENLNVSGSGLDAVRVDKNVTGTLKGGTITNPGGYALNVKSGATLNLTSTLNIVSSKTKDNLLKGGTINGSDNVSISQDIQQ